MKGEILNVEINRVLEAESFFDLKRNAFSSWCCVQFLNVLNFFGAIRSDKPARGICFGEAG